MENQYADCTAATLRKKLICAISVSQSKSANVQSRVITGSRTITFANSIRRQSLKSRPSTNPLAGLQYNSGSAEL